MEKSLRKRILYHYRRGNFTRGERDFRVILEKDGKKVIAGQWCDFGTFHKPRDIFKFIEEGWNLVAILSCFQWFWEGWRYVGDYYGGRWQDVEEDHYGRSRVNLNYLGYFDILDLFENGKKTNTYHHKYWHCLDTDEEKTIYGKIPDKIEKEFYELPWIE